MGSRGGREVEESRSRGVESQEPTGGYRPIGYAYCTARDTGLFAHWLLDSSSPRPFDPLLAQNLHPTSHMANPDKIEPSSTRDELSSDELAEQEAAELPDRDAMSLVNLNAAIPINAAAALNVLSDGSTADAGALQQDPLNQGV